MNIEEIRGRLDAATPGPWHLDAGGDTGVYTERRASGTSRDVASAFERNDEVFIAHAPEDMRRLLNAVEAVLETATKLDRCHAAGTPYAGQMIREAIRAALEAS